MARWFGRNAKARATGLRHGFRSGLEVKAAEQLKAAGQKQVRYEIVKIKYVVPLKVRTYSLDFELDNGIMVETKGIFEAIDRAKHLFIRTQHPELDIRFVFTNPNAKLRKGSPTSYADWCEKYGFKFAAKTIPEEWLTEPGPGAGGKRVIQVDPQIVAEFSAAEPIKVTERQGLFTRRSTEKKPRDGKASGLPLGVYKSRDKFVAQARDEDGKTVHIGVYDTPGKASAAYGRWQRKHVRPVKLRRPLQKKK